MNITLYFHDAALPHSLYIIETFKNNKNVSHLNVLYPIQREADQIFSIGNAKLVNNQKLTWIPTLSYKFRPKWAKFISVFKILSKINSDYIIVLDEAYSINCFNVGLASKIINYSVPVVCYGFENIIQKPPIKLLKSISISSFWTFFRKTARYIFVDLFLELPRRYIIDGAIVSYSDCEKVIRQNGWNLPVIEQWWGIDYDLFYKAGSKAKKNYNENKNFVIGFVGRFVEEKGILDLIQALNLLDKNYSVVCIGAGELEIQIRNKIESLNLKDRITIMPPMKSDEISEQMAKFNVLVLPSKKTLFWAEQYGRVLVEAMAAGIPVVGSNSGAIPYVIEDKKCIFPEGDITALKETIEEAIKVDINYKINLVKRARKGSVDTFVETFFKLYNLIVNEGKQKT